jgi:hypothetical protein
MKGILRKTEKGIIFTIDERPKEGEWAYSLNLNIITKIENEWDVTLLDGLEDEF